MPPGSRIATSRINFKLVAREAAERKMNIVAVSDEPQVRALAISAGLPAYDSIATAEQALATFREQDRQLSERVNRTMPREHPDRPWRGPRRAGHGPPPRAPRGARSAAPDAPPHAALHRPRVRRLPAARRTFRSIPRCCPPNRRPPRATAAQKRRIPVAPLLVFGLVVLFVAGVGYGAYVFLPTATITLRPSATQHPGAGITVTADPNVAVVDQAAGVIPAQTISVPVHVQGTFNATGIEAHDVKAAGSVRFHSENTLNAVPLPADTVVSTADGVEFVTSEDVTVPKASFATGPTQADVGVRAAKGGTQGNVDADTITVVPPLRASRS